MKKSGREIINILLVEDNPVDALLAQDALKHCKLYQPKTKLVDSLAGANKHLDRNTPDAILLDLGLPDSDGLETYFKIREIAPQIPVVILSGSGHQDTALAAVQNGAKDYLIKSPESYEYLDRAIRYAVEAGRIELLILARTEKLREVSTAAVQLADIGPDEDLNAIITQSLRNLSGALLTHISIVKDENLLSIQHISGLSKTLKLAVSLLKVPLEGIEYKLEDDIFTDLLSGKSRLTKNLSESVLISFLGPGELNKIAKLMGIGEILFLPLRHGNTLVGICSVVFKKNSAPVEDLRQFLEVFTNAAAIALQKQDALQQLLESEEKYRDVVEHANDGIVIIQDGLITYTNARAADMKGKPPEEMIGSPFTDNVTPENLSMISDYYSALMGGDEIPQRLEIEFVSPDGQRMTVDINASLIEHRGQPAIMAVIRDITERRQVEKEQLARIERSRRQHEAIMKLSSEKYRVEKDFSKNLPGILAIITEAMGVERASYWGQTRDYEFLDCISLYTRSAGEQTVKMKLTQDEYPAYLQAIKSGVPLDAHDALNDPRTVEFRENYLIPLGITSMLDTAVKAGGRTYGVICLEHVGDPREWTDDEIAFASFASNQISNFLLDMERGQAQQELKKYQAGLEQKVFERTEALNLSLSETEAARDRIDAILSSIGDGLIVTDLSNRVLLMNGAAEDMLGVHLSDVINQPIESAISDKILEERLITTLGLRSTGQTFDFELLDPDAEYPRIMRARTAVISDREGQQTGIITIIHDVSHEREVDRMKTEFISTAAHELRTPLTSIRGFSEILMTREDLDEQEKAKFLGHINRQSTALANIINDLLDISRIESGRGFALNLEECEAGEATKAVVEPFITQAPQHKFKVSLPEKTQTLMVDKNKLAQTLENVIGNAVKYSPDGGEISVSGRVDEARYVVTVEDHGIGMKPEQLERIFDKFYRVDSSNTAVEGTGLGMSIAKAILDAHGGEIEVESEYGIGTKVTFWLPLPIKHHAENAKPVVHQG